MRGDDHLLDRQSSARSETTRQPPESRAQIGKVHDRALADGQVECRSGQVDFHEITQRERHPIVQADHTRQPLGVVESSGCELDPVAPASVLFREQSRRAPKARSDVQHEPARSDLHGRRERSRGVCPAGVILVGRSADRRFREVPRCQTVRVARSRFTRLSTASAVNGCSA